MTPAELLPLALDAIGDEDASLVLADALEEAGWYTRANGIAVHAVIYQPDYAICTEWDGEHVREWFRFGLTPGQLEQWRSAQFILAIAAVLLFGAWSTEMWPAARRCLDPMGLILFGVDRTIMQQMERLGSIGIDAEALRDYLRSPAPTPAHQGRRRRPR